MQEAIRAGQPYVTKRWLGGMMTNFVTIQKRIGLLDQLEARQLAGDFDRLPKKEAARLTEELNKLQATLGGIRKMKRQPGRHLHRRPAPRAHRRDRGEQARDPGRRHGRHERRPRRARLHHPGQRRRDPLDPAAVPARRRRRDRGCASCGPPASQRARGRRGSRRPTTSRSSTRPPRPTWSPSSPPAGRSRSTRRATTTSCSPAPPSRTRRHAGRRARRGGRRPGRVAPSGSGPRAGPGMDRTCARRRDPAPPLNPRAPCRGAPHTTTGDPRTMAEITAAAVKQLRELTGAGFMDCKRALEEAGGDVDKAVAAAAREGPRRGPEEVRPRGARGPRQQLHPPRRPPRRADRGQLRDGLRRAHRRVPEARQGPRDAGRRARPDLRRRRRDPGRRPRGRRRPSCSPIRRRPASPPRSARRSSRASSRSGTRTSASSTSRSATRSGPCVTS